MFDCWLACSSKVCRERTKFIVERNRKQTKHPLRTQDSKADSSGQDSGPLHLNIKVTGGPLDGGSVKVLAREGG